MIVWCARVVVKLCWCVVCVGVYGLCWCVSVCLWWDLLCLFCGRLCVVGLSVCCDVCACLFLCAYGLWFVVVCVCLMWLGCVYVGVLCCDVVTIVLRVVMLCVVRVECCVACCLVCLRVVCVLCCVLCVCCAVGFVFPCGALGFCYVCRVLVCAVVSVYV